eukprot:TRINITY_DN1529_c0_g2_i1.p1 TRINITY_DN1529_c0_g2~~TRINITY_DN1529_c0_g2_i1.p1  ORF type:complete len:504 (+),score=145.33 TRINITY_DN1529_c0_g2_i1:122-1633(+)
MSSDSIKKGTSHNFAPSPARTGCYIAALRAYETTRQYYNENLIFDPYAEEFGAGYGEEMLHVFAKYRSGVSILDNSKAKPNLSVHQQGIRLAVDITTIRTKFLDDVCEQKTREGIDQVVILGCGFDTRSKRLNWPRSSVKVFEVDFDEVIDYREKIFSKDPYYYELSLKLDSYQDLLKKLLYKNSNASSSSSSSSSCPSSSSGITLEFINKEYRLRSHEHKGGKFPTESELEQLSQDQIEELLKEIKYLKFLRTNYETVMDREIVVNRYPVKGNLCENSWYESLIKSGFDKNQPSIWILEGLSMYFDSDEFDKLLLKISELSSEGSYISMDLFNHSTVFGNYLTQFNDHWEEWGAKLKFGHDNPNQLLERFGFTQKEEEIKEEEEIDDNIKEDNALEINIDDLMNSLVDDSINKITDQVHSDQKKFIRCGTYTYGDDVANFGRYPKSFRNFFLNVMDGKNDSTLPRSYLVLSKRNNVPFIDFKLACKYYYWRKIFYLILLKKN